MTEDAQNRHKEKENIQKQIKHLEELRETLVLCVNFINKLDEKTPRKEKSE